MEPILQKILVVGGNGFIGSAVCKVALARGMQVTSISSSGKPYQSAKGHSPAWSSKVDWQRGNALKPETYAHILPGVSGVVHTLGTLLEDGGYKKPLRDGDLGALLGSFWGNNPLEKATDVGGYEVLNRDAALRVCEAFLASRRPVGTDSAPRPFVYVSAEDIFRPIIPARYIETKREAERRIDEMMLDRSDYRAVHIRPSLVYHAHQRPLTSPIAAILDLSASLHSHVPPHIPTPSSVLRSIGSASAPPPDSQIASSPLDSVANALTIPPIHVEHVAEAICVALNPARSDIKGAVGVRKMRELIGWSDRRQPASELNQHA
jgi:nucleoside-diphosphate-sugar epimerase